MKVEPIECRSILTPTGGFLEAFSHSANPYVGCSLGRAACGVFCYASEMRFGEDRGRPWGSYLRAKTNAAEVYPKDLARARRKGPVRIFMASVTDPWVPQEKTMRVTRRLLEAMAAAPPDALVLQTHTPGPLRDLDLLAEIDRRAALAVQITVETDREDLPGLPPQAASVGSRIDALRRIREAGLRSVAVVAPLLPLRDEAGFARALGEAADSVILDHYLIGDGSNEGARTRRRKAHADRTLPEWLEARSWGAWNDLDRFERVVEMFRETLGPERVGVSREGFHRIVAPPSAAEPRIR